MRAQGLDVVNYELQLRRKQLFVMPAHQGYCILHYSHGNAGIAGFKMEDGRQRIVRHGHLPEREVMTGIGPVVVRQPRERDCEVAAGDPGRIFTPAILPPYLRRSKSIETALPILYLKGISTGDFSEALAALLGKDALGLSPTAIARLKGEAWQRRDLSAKRYVYVWADGIYLRARLEDEKHCVLVLIGATPEGRKELIGFTDGARKSAQDWRDLLLDLKRRGLTLCGRNWELPTARSASGKLPAKSGRQRANSAAGYVLAKLPNSQQPKAKPALQESWMAETSLKTMASAVRFDRQTALLVTARLVRRRWLRADGGPA